MQRIAIDMDDVMAETALHIINKINKFIIHKNTKTNSFTIIYFITITIIKKQTYHFK